MAPGILPVAIWPLMKSSIRESFSSESAAFGGGPKSAADELREQCEGGCCDKQRRVMTEWHEDCG